MLVSHPHNKKLRKDLPRIFGEHDNNDSAAMTCLQEVLINSPVLLLISTKGSTRSIRIPVRNQSGVYSFKNKKPTESALSATGFVL